MGKPGDIYERVSDLATDSPGMPMLLLNNLEDTVPYSRAAPVKHVILTCA